MVDSQALQNLHGRDPEHEAQPGTEMWCWKPLGARIVGIGGELDQITQGEGRHDLKDGSQELAETA